MQCINHSSVSNNVWCEAENRVYTLFIFILNFVLAATSCEQIFAATIEDNFCFCRAIGFGNNINSSTVNDKSFLSKNLNYIFRRAIKKKKKNVFSAFSKTWNVHIKKIFKLVKFLLEHNIRKLFYEPKNHCRFR